MLNYAKLDHLSILLGIREDSRIRPRQRHLFIFEAKRCLSMRKVNMLLGKAWAANVGV